jgi:UDP-N-acetylmuramyl pentapeptide phosphotransferase/UDP-N-acetylglucosamine-1-phosphate transferase
MLHPVFDIECVVATAAASFSASLLIILTQRWHGRLSLDEDMEGVQKLHLNPVPRVGGLAILAGVITSCMHTYPTLSGLSEIVFKVGALAWQYDDTFVFTLALVGAAAMGGFMLTNYPTGAIFMGDGGAYLMGFWCAEVAVLAVSRNIGISTWQILAIFAYPVIEVLYSIYRKVILRRMSPGVPDHLHLHMHMLIYRRLCCLHITRSTRFPWLRNAAATWITTTWIGTMASLAVIIGDSVVVAIALVAFQFVLYMALYTRLIRGRWCLTRASGTRVYVANRSRPA